MNLYDPSKNPKFLEEFEIYVDLVCAVQRVFQFQVDSLESDANDFTRPIDSDGEKVALTEQIEELTKEISRVVSKSITEYLQRDEQSDRDQRTLNLLLRLDKSICQMLSNLQSYRWIILSVDGGLAPHTGRTFDNADEFVKAQLEEA